jgi:hypothetical protein
MSESTKRESNGCADVRELVPWYPTGTLSETERGRVEDHVSGCETCAALLDFSAEVKEMMVEVEALHPSPARLVDFVEDASVVNATERETIETHLVTCVSCREQVDALERVDLVDAPVGRPAQHARRAQPSPFSRFWDTLRHGFLGPVPAAMYLIFAIVAAGFLLRSTGDGPIPDSVIAPAGGVVIVPDERDPVRQAIPEQDRGVAVDASISHLLLLELTVLETPPGDDDEYSVTIASQSSGIAAITTTVSGVEFKENYTIAFVLQAGVLEAGDYTVAVTDPDGETVFQSALTIRR